MLIDTHLHLVDRTRLDYPWLADAPALDKDWSYDDYETVAKRVGIAGTLHMEVDVASDDIAAETDFIGELMTREGSLIRGAISSTRPENEGFEASLEAIDRQVVKGFRRVLHVVPDDLSRSTLFRNNVSRLGEAGFPFDICVLARQLDIATELTDACEKTIFILDHCGVPDIAGNDFDSWSAAISEIARRPHVNAKISGISAYASPNWTLETLRPYVEHIIAAFGWDRVVWGSDSPVCTLNASLEQWVAATFALTAGASEDERSKLFNRNAKRIWNLS